MEQKVNINNSFYFIRETAKEERYGVSKVDLLALSYAYVLQIPLVTDDSDLIKLGNDYEVKVYKSLELLKLLYDCGQITIEKIRSIANYWVYLKDTPRSYGQNYRKLFDEKTSQIITCTHAITKK